MINNSATLGVQGLIVPPGLRVGDPLNDPFAILGKICTERWQDFHESCRLLVLDDNRGFLRHLTGALDELYEVEGEINPESALRAIIDAAERGNPFRVVCLDICMPKMQGTEFMKRLGALGDDIPAIIIVSGDISIKERADLAVDMGSYISSRARKLFEVAADARRAQDLPVVAIQHHHKLGTLSELVDKIDSALLVRKFSSNETSTFLSSYYNPSGKRPEIGKELVYDFCQALHNFYLRAAEALQTVKKSPEFLDSDWWSKHGSHLESALVCLANASFETIWSERLGVVGERLHALVNRFIEANAPRDIPVRGNDVEWFLSDWSSFWDQTKKILSAIFDRFEDHKEGKLDLVALVRERSPNLSLGEGLAEDKLRSMPFLKDSEGVVANFVSQFFSVHARRGEKSGSNRSIGASIDFVREGERSTVRIPDSRFSEIDCGDYVLINLWDYCQDPLDADFADVYPLMGAFHKNKLGIVGITTDHGRTHVELVIKLSGRSESYKAELAHKQKLSVKQPDGSWVFFSKACGEVRVWEDRGMGRDIIIVGPLPEQIIHERVPSVLFNLGDFKVITTQRSGLHYSSFDLLLEFLCEYFERNLDSRSREYKYPKDLYKEVLRADILLYPNSSVEVLLDLSPGKQEGHWAPELLREIGFAEDEIICDSTRFRPKS